MVKLKRKKKYIYIYIYLKKDQKKTELTYQARNLSHK
jgi:hypothetical protein